MIEPELHGTRMAISLSGGGYRAAAFELGVLLCIEDSGLMQNVAAISSVSGGSIVNAYASLGIRQGVMASDRSVPWPGGLLELLAHRSLYRFSTLAILAPTSILFVMASIALVAISQFTMLSAWFVFAAVATTLFLGVYHEVRNHAYLQFLLAITGARHRPLLTKMHSLAFGFLRAMGRGTTQLCHFRVGSFLETMRTPVDPEPIRLSEVHSAYVPVFCTTDLVTGEPFYVADRFVAGRSRSKTSRSAQPLNLMGRADDWSLASAVIASAAFPAVFQPLRVKSYRFELTGQSVDVPKALRLTDGGIFDNLGFSFFRLWQNDLLSPSLKRTLGKQPEFYVIVDGSALSQEGSTRSGAIRSIKHSVDVIHYANSQARRDQCEALIFAGQVRGVIIDLADDPYTIATETQDASRRQHLLDELDSLGVRDKRLSRRWWEETCHHHRSLRTDLRRLGSERTASLVLHGYVVAYARLVLQTGHRPSQSLPTLKDLELRRSRRRRRT